MAGRWTSDRFPQFESAIRSLTEQHRELEDEPLHLAVSYLPALRDQQDIYLFEVIGTPSESINPDRDWLEATFQSGPGFPMDFDEALHLVLTNPHEVNVALEQHWPLAVEVVNAIREGDYQVLYQDRIGEEVFAKLQAEASLQGLFRG